MNYEMSRPQRVHKARSGESRSDMEMLQFPISGSKKLVTFQLGNFSIISNPFEADFVNVK